MPTPADCPQATDSEALEGGTLSPERREQWERHLESCPLCQERLDQADRCTGELVKLCRLFGDPTAAPRDPTLTRALEKMHLTISPPRAHSTEPPELYFLRPAASPELLGTLGEYEVQEVIGVGGMGVVLKAFDPALHRLVAIKVLAAALAGSATARRRFTREAQAAAAVCHEHVVTVHGVDEVDGLPYLVMQYVAGESLQDRLDRSGPPELVEIVRIGHQTAVGLAVAHAQGLIHRDIKPANLLMENGLARVKITDFGLARMIDDVGLTQNGVVAGTPEYMAPEQARGESVDYRSDLFSLGSVLYAMCTGSPPFRAATTMGVLRCVSEKPASPVRSINADVPAWLAELIDRLMAKDPAERFQSAAEVAALLEGFLAHLQQPTIAAAPQLPERKLAWRASSRWFVWLTRVRLAACLAILVVLGSIVYLLAGRGAGKALLAQAGAGSSEPITLLRGHTGPVHDVRFTSDRRLVSTSGWPQGDQSVRVWDGTTCQELARIATPGEVHSLDISPDKRFALVGLSTGTILSIDLETQQKAVTLKGHRKPVDWVAFAADGAHAFSASVDGTARMWDLTTQKQAALFRVAGKWARHGAVFSDGKRLLTADNDGLLQIWDLSTHKEIKRIDAGPWIVDSLLLRPDDRHVLVAGVDGLRLFDLETGEAIRKYQAEHEEVYHCALSPDGRLLTASFDGVVRLWNFESGELLRELGAHPGFAFSVAFSPDGRTAASGGGGERRDGKYLAGSDHDIRLWDVGPPVATQSARERGWLLPAGIVLLVMVLSTIGGLYVLRRARRSSKAQAETSKGEKGGHALFPPVLAVQCPGCGKTLRAKAELAGKKVKCPNCGRTLQLEAAGAD
jgi:WD40 repeat protein